MTDTQSRREQVDFSLTFFATGAQFLVKKGTPIKGIQTIAGKRVAAQQGSTNAKIIDRKSTRLNSSHLGISYAVFCLKKKTNTKPERPFAGESLAAKGSDQAHVSAAPGEPTPDHARERTPADALTQHRQRQVAALHSR